MGRLIIQNNWLRHDIRVVSETIFPVTVVQKPTTKCQQNNSHLIVFASSCFTLLSHLNPIDQDFGMHARGNVYKKIFSKIFIMKDARFPTRVRAICRSFLFMAFKILRAVT